MAAPLYSFGGPMATCYAKILWGSKQTREENTPSEYCFANEGEREMFMEGVNEAIGWLDYELIEPEEDGS